MDSNLALESVAVKPTGLLYSNLYFIFLNNHKSTLLVDKCSEQAGSELCQAQHSLSSELAKQTKVVNKSCE